MKTAVYGRMRISRCLTAEEVDELRSGFGDDPRYFGCSADILDLLDRKCSGKIECDIRVNDISFENIKPCLPGLVVYLEVSYNCITGRKIALFSIVSKWIIVRLRFSRAVSRWQIL